MRPFWLLFCCGALATACKDSEAPKSVEDKDDTGAACPVEGRSLARTVVAEDVFPGETAVGRAGDVLLMNSQAAYVVTAAGADTTYWYYGGIVADAYAVADCALDGEDKLDEIGIVMGELDLLDYTSSVLRAFEATSVEVLDDGSSGGAAVVRAKGVDATHWLVEYTLIGEAVSDGGRPVSEPYNLEVTVDYILEPDSPVLKIQLTVLNNGTVERSLLGAYLLSFAGSMDVYTYPTSRISAGPLDLGMGMPWLVATDGDDALAFAVENGNLAYVGISGIDIAIDANQALTSPMAVGPGESDSRSAFLVVGPGDGTTATAPLAAANPEPIPGQSYTLGWVSGTVVGPSGETIAGARILVEALSPGGDWGVLDEARSDTLGGFSIPVPAFDTAWEWRLVADIPGRAASSAVSISVGDEDVLLQVGAAGTLQYTVVDGDGQPSPARLALRSASGDETTLWLNGSDTADLVPGAYTYTATRGYEYAPVIGDIEVPEGGEAVLDIVLDHVVDTTGWVSIDTHVHSWDSPDSRVDPADVLLHAAAHGLDVVLHTEHEHIVDRRYLPVERGLDSWVTNMVGEEVTASLPEHLTMFPSLPDGTPRGGPVEWYGRDLDELFALMRERSGGGVNLINHPDYLRTIQWDRMLAEPGLDDPTLFGLLPGASLWSWNLDGMEVMNGHRSPFGGGNGRWLDWQSMLNAGHPLVPVGCSDDHDGSEVGFPRTYVPSVAAHPSDITVEEVVDAFHAGQVVVGAGAFARVSVDGELELGSLVVPSGPTVDIAVEVQAIPQVDVTHIVVFVNCDTVLRVPATDPGGVVKLNDVLTVAVDTDAHITLAGFGAQRFPDGLPQFDAREVPRFITAPIYIDADGDGAFTAPGGRECAVWLDAPTE